ncbi:MAG: DUF4421 family protein [Bacteroidota bacterium]
MKYLLTCILFIILLSASAIPSDSLFIGRYAKKYSLKLFVSSRNTSFSLRPNSPIDSIKSKVVYYIPNLGYSIGLAASYKFFVVSLSVKIPNSTKDESIYGSTSYQDFQIHLYQPKIGAATYYRRYKGFYIDKPQNIITHWNSGDALPQRPDIEMEDIGLNAFYVFNDKEYSLRAAYRQTEKQIKSASSFLIKADFNKVNITGDSSFLPSQVESYFGNMQGLKAMSFTSFGVMAGYTRTKVIKKNYYFTPSIFVGPGYNIKYFDTKISDYYNNTLSLKFNLRLGAGYNTSKNIFGFLFETDANLMPEKEIRFQSTFFTLNVFYGRRF